MAKGIVKYRTGEDLEPIAQAITSMGQVASKEDKTIRLAEKVKKISTDATATPTQILSGQTAYVNGQKITGTMPNRGANNIVLPVNGTATIPEGYHNGQGRVSQNLVTQGAYTNAISSVGVNPAYIRIPQGYYGTNTVSGYPEIVYSLDMARSSGYALQSEVDHWRNSYYGMEQDRNNWINVANSRPNVSKHEYSVLITRDERNKTCYLNEAFFQYGIVAVIRIKKLVMYYSDQFYNVLATPHMIYLYGIYGVGGNTYYERNFSIGGTGNIVVSSYHWSEKVQFPGTSKDFFHFFTNIYINEYDYKNAYMEMRIGEKSLSFYIESYSYCNKCEVEFEVTHYHVQ